MPRSAPAGRARRDARASTEPRASGTPDLDVSGTAPLRGHVGQVLVGRVRPGGRRASRPGAPTRRRGCGVARDGTARSPPVPPHRARRRRLVRRRTATLVTASRDGTARTWRRQRKAPPGARRPPGPVVMARRSRPTRRVVTGGADGTLRLWDPGHAASSSSSRRRSRADAPTRRRRASSRTGDVVATGRWATSSASAPRERRAVLRGHTDVVNTRRLQPRRLAARHRRARPRRHRLGRRERRGSVHRFEEAQSASVADARFSPDGRWIVTAGPISARLWNVADGRR